VRACLRLYKIVDGVVGATTPLVIVVYILYYSERE